MKGFNLRAAPQLSTRDDLRVWVFSDIQQDEAPKAESLLASAVDDMLGLDLELDAVWCLGDALRGTDEAALEKVTGIFFRELARLNVPVCHLMGNHDMDFRRASNLNRFPLFERAAREANWHTMEHLDALFFARRMGNCLAVFMGDHADPNGGWFTTHGGVSGDAPHSYPHGPAAYARLSRALGEYPGPVILCAHYALPGGQKPSPLMAQMLPLPVNVRLCLHGHAHIGDLVWNKENPWRRVNPVPEHTLTQVNISALESTRSPGSHSALLEIGSKGPLRLHIRCHAERRWLETVQLGSAG